LPLVHTTDVYRFTNVLEDGVLEPRECDVFKGEPLLYFFYGRPSYRINASEGATGLDHYLPVCFLFRNSAVTPIKRIFPFDSGGFHNELYADAFHKEMKLDDFGLEPDQDTPGRVISLFFESADAYSGAPKTRKEFLTIFPSNGFGLVGRALGSKDIAPESILRDAIASTLNESLPLHTGRRLVLIGPPSIVDNSHVLSFLNRAAEATLNETMSIVSSSRKSAATVLAFGITPVTRDERRHREFCLELLHTRGFSMHRDSEDFVYGTFPKEKRTLAIGFSSSMQSLDEASAALRKAPFTTRCLLTNFALSPSHTKYFRNREIAVFHYSVLDTYLDRRMTLPLIQRGH